jgi:hypothetical protein
LRLIGINGLKRSGKDTTYQIIKEISEAKVERKGFSDKLKIMAAKALGFDRPDEELIKLMDSFKETAIFRISYDDPEHYDPAAHYGAKTTAPLTLHTLTGRQYLQWFGENARQVFGDTFWIDQVLPEPSSHPVSDVRGPSNLRSLLSYFPNVDILCMPDTRYPNEAKRILALGGEVWEIKRPGTASDGHTTEQPLPRELITQTINNDGSLPDLEREVEIALNA